MKEIGENIETIDLEPAIAKFLHENPDIAIVIRTSALGIGVAVVVGTLLEDILTLGIGISDDWLSFLIAYRIVRIAIL